MGKERFFGCHVSSSGGVENAAKMGKLLGVNTIQLHPSPPQRWNSSAFKPGTEDLFLAECEGSCVKQVFFHAIYLINLANPDPQQQHLSRTSLLHYLDFNARLKGAGVIFHVGSLKDEPEERVGWDRAASSINWVMDNFKGKSRLILEVAAGSGKVIGDRFEDLQEIYAKVEDKDRVGFGLDSQHMWASGYDLKGNLEGTIEDLERTLGIDKVWSVHLNDSKTELASRKDRHENIGSGLIGEKALKAFLNHEKLKHIPFILETPDLKDEETSKIAVARLRSLVE